MLSPYREAVNIIIPRQLKLMIIYPAIPAVLPPDRQNVQMTGRMFFPHQPEKSIPATAFEEDDTQCSYSRSLSCCTARKNSYMLSDWILFCIP